MEADGVAANHDETAVLHRWSARKMRPVVLLYVAAVFGGLATVSYVALDSMTGVKALVLASVGYIVPLVPMVLSRIEFRLSDRGLDRRPLGKQKPRDFERVFRWHELSHIVPRRFGFKYFKTLDESNPLRRFAKLHFSDAYAGEVQVERADRDRVLAVLSDRGVSVH